MKLTPELKLKLYPIPLFVVGISYGWFASDLTPGWFFLGVLCLAVGVIFTVPFPEIPDTLK